MIIESVASGPFETNSYLVGCEKEHVGIFIDAAPASADKLLSFMKKHTLDIIGIYLTHSHYDHFADAHFLKNELKCPLFVHIEDRENLHKPGFDGIPKIIEVKAVSEDGLLEEGQIVSVGSLQFRVIHTPGHSPGGVCFYFEKEKILFSGDVLFKGTHGNVSFPSSNEEKMDQSLIKLMDLPDDVVVYPGHFGKTTIGEERSWIMS